MPSISRQNSLRDLILVAGHAAFKEGVERVPEHPEKDEAWVLLSYQRGEPPFYVEHIRRGIVLATRNPASLLIFSGGRTREDAGKWSEANTYYHIAEQSAWWIPESQVKLRMSVAERAITEDYARDSFENLLFSVCRFEQNTGYYPRNVSVVSWDFKRVRFNLHRAAIRFPESRFRYEGFNDPVDQERAWKGETRALCDFVESRYGSSGRLGQQRSKRDPFNLFRQNSYSSCEGLKEFFGFIYNPDNSQKHFPGRLPWED